MSIPALVQTYEEVRRLAIAGSAVAPGNFRLKKLVPTLEQSGQKAPVFAKVAEAVGRLVESTEQTSAAALLDLATLINSILYTQGETGAEGELAPLPTVELGRHGTRASARVLKPLQEALTTTGSGRLEIIRDGLDRRAFDDPRMVNYALGAIDDSYAEIADLVANKILPRYGKAIVPELVAGFDPKGRGGQVRRLALMHRLDPAAARPQVLRAIEEGSAEVRVAAIGCLGDSAEDLPFLLEQSKSRAKDVRTAALRALGRGGSDEAARTLCEAMRSDALPLAVEPLRESRHPTVTAALLDQAEQQFNDLISSKEKDEKKLGKRNERMGLLLDCLKGREDPRTEKLLLGMFENLGRLAAVKGEPSGKDVIEQLIPVLAEGPPAVRDALIDSHATLPPECLGHAFAAARKSRKPAEVFDLFSPYLAGRADEKKKRRGPESTKREAIAEELLSWGRWGRSAEDDSTSPAALDPRWLDLAIEQDRFELVQVIAVPGHAGARAFLSRLFRENLAKKGKEYELAEILDAMIRAEHPEATDSAIELIRSLARGKATYGYGGLSYWIGRLLAGLPRAEAVPKLEALLPTLPENMIDQLLGCLTDLKKDAPPAASPE